MSAYAIRAIRVIEDLIEDVNIDSQGIRRESVRHAKALLHDLWRASDDLDAIRARLDALEAKGAAADPPAEPVREVGWYPGKNAEDRKPFVAFWDGHFWRSDPANCAVIMWCDAWIGPRLDIPEGK